MKPVKEVEDIDLGIINYYLEGMNNTEKGFSSLVEKEVSKTFYSERVQPDPFGVAAGFSGNVPRSIFNKFALYNFRGMYGGDLTGTGIFDDYFDGPDSKINGGINAKNVSISKIIEFFQEHYPKIAYRYQDFLYSKWYKKIPPNHLITLRRFGMPVLDNIFNFKIHDTSGEGESSINTPSSVDITQVSGVTAITYLGEESGNKLEDILNFSMGLSWKQIESEMQEIQTQDGGYTQQPFYQKLGDGLIGGTAREIIDTMKGVPPAERFKRQFNSAADRLGTTYPNFVFGPINVVKETTVRDRGVNFSNDIKLTFEYELKSLNYVNPKIAMIDIISNMLTMSTNNAQFWGGGQRYYGSAGYVASQFGNPKLLRAGNFHGYIHSVTHDISTSFMDVFGDEDGGFSLSSIWNGISDKMTGVVDNFNIGRVMNNLFGGITSIEQTKALISAEPTGSWHLTVGNPLNPIVMMGNMYCDNMTMSLGKGLGFDDFPMELKFEIDLKHGKPRDRGDIENMFNAGRGRIYTLASDEEDVLNLQGASVETYGNIKAGDYKRGLQRTQSAANLKQEPKNISREKGYVENDLGSSVEDMLRTPLAQMIIG